jgi:hydrogenase maturation protease
MKPPILVVGYGNPSRGDDALAPLLLEELRARAVWTADEVELLTDFQLQVEHVLDLEGRRRVVFVDAAQRGPEPFAFDAIAASADPAPSSHALSPAALLSVYGRHFGVAAPPCLMLAIRGYSFKLGDDLSAGARRNLDAALAALGAWLADGGDGARLQTAMLPAGD